MYNKCGVHEEPIVTKTWAYMKMQQSITETPPLPLSSRDWAQFFFTNYMPQEVHVFICESTNIRVEFEIHFPQSSPLQVQLLQVFRPKNIMYIEFIHKDFKKLLHPFLKDLYHCLGESAQSILQGKWHYCPIKKAQILL